MPEQEAMEKSLRLSRITHCLYRNAQGLGTRELAQLCGVSQRTIQRDMGALERLEIPIWQEGRRYGLAEGYFLPPVHLSLGEAVGLYLAGRLLWRYSDEHNPHICAALAKLAAILPGTVAGHIQATLRAFADKPDSPIRSEVFEVIALGWATGRKVRIWYQAAASDHVHEYTLCPYFLEPSGVGYATYVIGHASYFDAVRTFKLERIHKAELLGETFEVPADLDLNGLLAGGWGVMYGEEMVEVRLCFSPRATRRVKESHWHTSEQIVDLPAGGCLYSVQVAHTLEMKPWIRGWGADCEVLAPQSLRQEIAAEVEALSRMYSTNG